MTDEAGLRPSPSGTGLHRGLRTLRHRNFRLLWAGQWARATGLWMQLVATPLLVLSIGGSAFDVGFVYALQFGPILFLAPVGGALADRIEKRRWVIVLQTISAVQAGLFVLVVAAGAVAMAHIYVLSAVMGLVNAAEMPTRVSLVAELVPDEDIPNAVALMMVAMNASRVIGPAIAGVIAAAFGFAANFGWSLVAALVTVVTVGLIDAKRTRPAPTRREGSVGEAVGAGIRYIAATPAVSVPLAILGMFGVFGISFQTILPIYAIDNLGLNGSGYGFLLAAMGVGAVSAALPMTLVSVPVARRIMFVAPLVFAGLLAALALNVSPHVAFLVIVPLGFCFVLINSSINVTVQGTVTHEFRGRTMGIYVSIMHGGGAIGGLVMGMLAELGSAPLGMLVGAATTATVIVALRLARPAQARPARAV